MYTEAQATWPGGQHATTRRHEAQAHPQAQQPRAMDSLRTAAAETPDRRETTDRPVRVRRSRVYLYCQAQSKGRCIIMRARRGP